MISCLNNLHVSECIFDELEEPDNDNKEATKWFIDNYDTVKHIAVSLTKDYNKAEDLAHDVFLSLTLSEERGDCFDMQYGYDETGSRIMEPAQFVIARLKGYAKNDKYNSSIVERGGEYTVYDEQKSGSISEDGVISKYGSKTKQSFIAVAASYDDGKDAAEKNDEFQLALLNAPASDSSMEALLYESSISDELNNSIDICELHNFNLINFLKNYDRIVQLYNKCDSIDKKIVDGITKIISENDDVRECLDDLFRLKQENYERYNMLLEAY